jgi:hypothetical protein
MNKMPEFLEETTDYTFDKMNMGETKDFAINRLQLTLKLNRVSAYDFLKNQDIQLTLLSIGLMTLEEKRDLLKKISAREYLDISKETYKLNETSTTENPEKIKIKIKHVTAEEFLKYQDTPLPILSICEMTASEKDELLKKITAVQYMNFVTASNRFNGYLPQEEMEKKQ